MTRNVGTLDRWYVRHLVVMVVSVATIYLFLESRAEWSPLHRWNRAVGDTSLFLLALSMAIGPAARLWRPVKRLLPWRRETGIFTVVLGAAHTIIILSGWVEWDLIKLFGYVIRPDTNEYIMLLHGFGLANIVGILALVYGFALILTSNDLSQKILGGATWKFVQRGAYVLWMLVLLHTAYFLYLHFQDFHRPVPDPNWLQVPFAFTVAGVMGLQLAAFWKTWRARKATPSKPMGPADQPAADVSRGWA